MPLNMRFDPRVVIDTGAEAWQLSPARGVWRKPLAREEAERGHATSIVRYDAGAAFARHEHPGGEEILVLDGVFSDEHGDFGPGTYFRNPPGTGHAPFSKQGCELFVKLHQFHDDDLRKVCVDTRTAAWQSGEGNLKTLPLHEFGNERVALIQWPAGARMRRHGHVNGEEILVVSGELFDEHGRYPAGTWLRSPHLSGHEPFVEVDTLIWIKTGHLPG